MCIVHVCETVAVTVLRLVQIYQPRNKRRRSRPPNAPDGRKARLGHVLW